MKVKKQQLEPDMEQWTGLKMGIYCHPAYLTYIQNTSCKMPGWVTHKQIKIAGRDTNNLRYTDDTTLMAENEKELKNLLLKRGE